MTISGPSSALPGCEPTTNFSAEFSSGIEISAIARWYYNQRPIDHGLVFFLAIASSMFGYLLIAGVVVDSLLASHTFLGSPILAQLRVNRLKPVVALREQISIPNTDLLTIRDLSVAAWASEQVGRTPLHFIAAGIWSRLPGNVPTVFSLIMTGEKTTIIRMNSRMLKRVDGIARAMSRSRSWVINDAVEHYLDYEEWFVAAVKRGLKEAAAGELWNTMRW